MKEWTEWAGEHSKENKRSEEGKVNGMSKITWKIKQIERIKQVKGVNKMVAKKSGERLVSEKREESEEKE